MKAYLSYLILVPPMSRIYQVFFRTLSDSQHGHQTYNHILVCLDEKWVCFSSVPDLCPLQSLLKRQGEMENGTVWSNSSESSDDSSSPALAHHTQRLTASNLLQTTLTTHLSLTPHKSSTSTPSLSSNQEEEETEAREVFPQADAVPNGHLQTSCSHIGESSTDCASTDRVSVQSADLSDTSADLSSSCPDVSSGPLTVRPDVAASGVPQVCISAEEAHEDASEDSSVAAGQTEAETEDSTTEAGQEGRVETSETSQSVQVSSPLEEASTVSSCSHFM